MAEQDLVRGKPRDVEPTLVAFLAVLFAMMLIRTAWIGDDAYFTLRTVDNFIHGYGLTWNIDERVQAYTHPLWMLALSAVYFLTHEAFYSTLLLSIVVSTCAFWLVLKSASTRNLACIAILCVPLFSKAFVDYSTSGLENPATHLLLAVFLLMFLGQMRSLNQKSILLFSLVAGLGTLNRMDTVLLYLPPLLCLAAQARSWRTMPTMAIGFIPFVLWEMFSVVYYGFPFPNPAYAKLLGNAIGHRELMSQGIQYFLYTLRWDPITLTVIVAAVSVAASHGSSREKGVAAGVASYLGYVVWIGGDFMAGRYFSGPLLVAVVLLAGRLRNTSISGGVITILLVLTLVFISGSPLLEATCGGQDVKGQSGISDSRAFHFSAASLTCRERSGIEPHHTWALNGLALRASGVKVAMYATGYFGYFAGPQVHLIDDFGLADPLIARLPYLAKEDWRIGHFARAAPAGYMKSIESGKNLIRSQSLAQYYDKLRLVTSGPIWSIERFATIWELNTGQADWLIRDYQG